MESLLATNFRPLARSKLDKAAAAKSCGSQYSAASAQPPFCRQPGSSLLPISAAKATAYFWNKAVCRHTSLVSVLDQILLDHQQRKVFGVLYIVGSHAGVVV